MSTILKNCKACGDLITVRLVDHRRGWGNFCDKACAAAHKCGQRPRDVNATHAKYSIWASERLAHFQQAYADQRPPLAPNVKAQTGCKERVTPIYHSPANCRDCGATINGPGLCDDCEARNETGLGWDAHKEWTA